MSNFITSLLQFFPTAAGAVANAAGSYELVAHGKPTKAAVNSLAGAATIHVGALGNDAHSNNVFKASVLAGTAVAAGRGLYNFCKGIYEGEATRALKGAVQLAAGAASTAVTYAASSRAVAVVNQALAIATLSGLVAYSGIRDLAKGKRLKGLAKTVIGVAGVATMGWLAYGELGTKVQPTQLQFSDLGVPEGVWTEGRTLKRQIRLATVYDNEKDPARRQPISDATTANHRKYAEKWNLEHDVVTKSLVKGQCYNPITDTTKDCSPYWNKIKYFKNWCENPSKLGHEEWAIYADDDAVYTNFQIDPSRAIDQLRGNKDSSFIIATEGEGSRYNPGAVNTGVMIVRKDRAGCDMIEKIWENRNVVTSTEKPDCPTHGLCSDQSNGDEQGATDKVLYRDAPIVLKNDVTRLLSRDATHPSRGAIALNTLNRGGCVVAQDRQGNLGGAFDIGDHDRRVNPEGMWQEGDWIGQTGGYPLYGRDLSHQPQGHCHDDPSVPVENIRLKKVMQMISSAEKTSTSNPSFSLDATEKHIPITLTPRPSSPLPSGPITRHIKLGAAYNNQDVHRQDIAAFVNRNHAEYAKKWGLEHEVVSKDLVASQCTPAYSKTPINCAPYWNKIAMLRNWLDEPRTPGVEEWRYYLDDDMLVMNQKVDPFKAIDQLRGGNDTSVIVAKDVIDWQRWFFDAPAPDAGINTGAFIVRKDDASREIFQAIWDLRHTPVTTKSSEDCSTIGNCNIQSRSMQEQEALAILIRRHPELLGTSLTVIAPRDTQSPTRGHLAMNTFYRKGCFAKSDGTLFTYEGMDNSENPGGAFQQGDWLTQVAGVPVKGKDLPFTWGNCINRNDVPETQVRLNKLKELSTQAVK